MVDYLEDIEVTSNLDIRIDSANDLGIVSGRDNLEQGIALSTADVTSQRIGQKVTAEELGFLEQVVEEYLDQDPHVGSVQRVQVTTFNQEANIVEMEVDLVEANFTIDVSLGV